MIVNGPILDILICFGLNLDVVLGLVISFPRLPSLAALSDLAWS